MVTSAAATISASGSLVDREDRARGPDADHVVELPARTDGHEQARRDRATGDPDLAGAGEPAPVGDLARGRELGAERGRERLELRIVGRVDALADAETTGASARRSRSSSRVRAEIRTRLRGVAGTTDSDGTCCRGARRGSTPARTVAICGRVAQWIAATSWPPNAGFHATSSSSIDVELHRVAGEAGTERGGGAGRDLAAPRGAGRQDRPRRSVARPARDGARGVLLVGDA